MNVKKTVASVLAVTALCGACISAGAADNPINNLGRPGYEKVNQVTNEAIYEGHSRAAKVTASDAWVDRGPVQSSGYQDEAAVGYVTVKDGTKNVYHYTRVELHRNGKKYAASDNIYGYGYVDASTNYYQVNRNVTSQARVFYGGF